MDAASTYGLSAIVRIDMRAVVQRVSRAAVRVEERIVGEIGAGLLVLLGVAAGDTDAEADALAGKVAWLRIFPDDGGRFDRSVIDTGGGLLVISQFTLLADTAKGNRPSFTRAAAPADAERLYERFCAVLAEQAPVERGVFGARMDVELVNDGPVTIVLG
jgi:D-aminoacyl-tRNA deacylase